jgi:hypothetical protein
MRETIESELKLNKEGVEKF